MIDRNPDINLDAEAIPSGMFLLEGKHLMLTARQGKIPFGVGYRREIRGGTIANVTKGLILREKDRAAMADRMEAREADKKRRMGKEGCAR